MGVILPPILWSLLGQIYLPMTTDKSLIGIAGWQADGLDCTIINVKKVDATNGEATCLYENNDF